MSVSEPIPIRFGKQILENSIKFSEPNWIRFGNKKQYLSPEKFQTESNSVRKKSSNILEGKILAKTSFCGEWNLDQTPRHLFINWKICGIWAKFSQILTNLWEFEIWAKFHRFWQICENLRRSQNTNMFYYFFEDDLPSVPFRSKVFSLATFFKTVRPWRISVNPELG